MCSIIGRAVQQAMSRRGFVTGFALGSAALQPFACTPVEAAAFAQAPVQPAAPTSRSALVLLGTAGGPTWWPNSDQCGISSAVVVGDAVYLVDCGEGVGKRLQQAVSASSVFGTMSGLRAVFLTHLHSDHTIDYPNLLLFGLYAGLDRPSKPLKVFGPGRRGQMEPIFTAPGAPAPAAAIMNSENPTPGTKDMTGYLYQAYATDINDRMRDNGKRDLRALVDARDIEIPPIAGFVTPNDTPAPPMEPFKVFEDDRVRVSAILVNHAPVWPAFAFRFDTDDGSIVFSGDTAKCDNLIKLARNADILVHEVILTSWANRLFPQPRSAADEGLLNHLLSAHTPVEDVGGIAEAAGVKTLVLSHIVPGNATPEQLAPAQRGFSGQLIIGRDLMRIGLGKTSATTNKG